MGVDVALRAGLRVAVQPMAELLPQPDQRPVLQHLRDQLVVGAEQLEERASGSASPTRPADRPRRCRCRRHPRGGCAKPRSWTIDLGVRARPGPAKRSLRPSGRRHASAIPPAMPRGEGRGPAALRRQPLPHASSTVSSVTRTAGVDASPVHLASHELTLRPAGRTASVRLLARRARIVVLATVPPGPVGSP